MYKLLNLLFCFLLASSGEYAQENFKYQPISISDYFSDTAYFAQFKKNYDEILSKGYYLEHGLPINFVQDGSVDYTLYLQKALNEHTYLVFPPFPILVNDQGLTLRSNSRLVFQKGSKLLSASSSKDTHYQVLKIWNVSNIQLFYPVVIGDRQHHIGNTGAGGMGISINNSENILIFSPQISECWGDGLYITGGKKPSKNIQIFNGLFNFNRRNGITVVSAKNLQLDNVICSNSYGTNPMSGIDIEPNKNSNSIDSFYFRDVYTLNNYKAGIKIQLRRLLKPDKIRNVNIEIINHHCKGSQFSFYFGRIQKVENLFKGMPQRIQGNIIIKDPVWRNYRSKPLVAEKYGQLGPIVKIISPKISSPNMTHSLQLDSTPIDTTDEKKVINFLKKSIKEEPKIKFYAQ